MRDRFLSTLMLNLNYRETAASTAAARVRGVVHCCNYRSGTTLGDEVAGKGRLWLRQLSVQPFTGNVTLAGGRQRKQRRVHKMGAKAIGFGRMEASEWEERN